MKNIFLNIFVILIISLFGLIPNIKADGIDIPVTFTLRDNFYSDVEKTYENDTITFYYTNNLLSLDLTDDQLKQILSQTSGSGSTRLVYYETLDIKVTPVAGTNFDSLSNKSILFRANGGGAWVNLINHNQDMQQTAAKYNLNNSFWPWGFKIQYRLNSTDNFTSTIPNNKDLTNKTLEQQLATVLDMDLINNPNAVINAYKTLWKFNPLPKGYTFLIRFDFFDSKNEIAPTLKLGTDDEYLVDSLKLLGTEYVAIKYDKTQEIPTSSLISTSKNNFNIPIIIPSLIVVIIAISLYYYKRKKIYIVKQV